MVRDPPVARDKFADPLPRGQILNKWSLTSNVTPTPLYTSTATPTPKIPKSSPLLLPKFREAVQQNSGEAVGLKLKFYGLSDAGKPINRISGKRFVRYLV